MTGPVGAQLTRSPAELEGEARLRRLQEIAPSALDALIIEAGRSRPA